MNQLRTIGAAILKHPGFFSIDQIMRETEISRPYLRDILALFCQEKILRQITKGRKEHVPGKVPMYSMIYHVVDRGKLVTRIAPRRYKNTVQDRMWFIIWSKFRNSGSFNLRDLVVLAGAKKGMAHWYLKMLRQAGYIAPSRRAGRYFEWKLTQNFGPVRPYLDHSRKIKKAQKCGSI